MFILIELLVGPLRALIQTARVLQHRALLFKCLILAGLNAGLLNFSILELEQFLLLPRTALTGLQLTQLLPGLLKSIIGQFIVAQQILIAAKGVQNDSVIFKMKQQLL